MRPEIVSLAKKLALHMQNEDALFYEIINIHPTKEEAVLLTSCIFRPGSITKQWE